MGFSEAAPRNVNCSELDLGPSVRVTGLVVRATAVHAARPPLAPFPCQISLGPRCRQVDWSFRPFAYDR